LRHIIELDNMSQVSCIYTRQDQS